MGAPELGQKLPPASAIQAYLDSHTPTAKSPHATELYHLAIQIAHNLRYQHLWTNVCLHTHSAQTGEAFPRPMISGVPPQRLYVHPDEQIELLQKQKDEGKSGMPELSREREWVLPSHLREKWSLRRFGETFNALTVVPPSTPAGELLFDHDSTEAGEDREPSKWRTSLPKRLLLATLDDDSTVVYYIVHDGLVKPRQN
ncbi:putative tRNA-splicing endonuclease subunit tsp-1 [Pseudocercospora fuligena]|uniref:Putative tRNA-splicing endonuclease subunit tsp-1 n=1 Tax=Pseudocercospora fuligena TaxID=685502 RepID=A0A8H6VCJ7_9PEZI|nr:putative tRNA-splicing endonuclease subunit tsp-1 [Pseudocercospora fuligena]